MVQLLFGVGKIFFKSDVKFAHIFYVCDDKFAHIFFNVFNVLTYTNMMRSHFMF